MIGKLGKWKENMVYTKVDSNNQKLIYLRQMYTSNTNNGVSKTNSFQMIFKREEIQQKKSRK